MSESDPKEVHAIAGSLLAIIGEHVSCSDEVLVAALKVTANIIEETKQAHVSATLRASIIRQYGGGKR